MTENVIDSRRPKMRSPYPFSGAMLGRVSFSTR
jgi:hypothetical protein